jgi:hypothetical protein
MLTSPGTLRSPTLSATKAWYDDRQAFPWRSRVALDGSITRPIRRQLGDRAAASPRGGASSTCDRWPSLTRLGYASTAADLLLNRNKKMISGILRARHGELRGALMLCWDTDMPDDVARAYAVWDGPAAGNVSATARLLGMRRPTVQDWSTRYRVTLGATSRAGGVVRDPCALSHRMRFWKPSSATRRVPTGGMTRRRPTDGVLQRRLRAGPWFS